MKFIYKIKNTIQGFTHQNFKNKISGGFSLIEALTYSALLSMFLFASILFTSNIISANSRTTEHNELLVNQEFLEKKLNWIVGQSNNITLPVSGASGSILTLAGTNASLFPASFSLVNNQVVLTTPGESNIPLTSNKVNVSNFSIINIVNQASVPAIRITFILSSINLPTITSTSNFSYVSSQ